MLKKRVIPVLLLKGFDLVKGPGFDSWRKIGSCLPLIKVYNSRDVDELVILDIDATPQNKKPDFKLIQQVTQECMVPVSYGGGIKTLEDAVAILRGGADKVVLNSVLYQSPEIIDGVSRQFGSQSIVVSLDYEWENGVPVCYSHCGKKNQGVSVLEMIRRLDQFPFGEILLTQISRDGNFKGYDLEILKNLPEDFRKPVSIAGGASKVEDFLDVFRTNPKVSGVCAASVFAFTELTPRDVKNYLSSNGIKVRI